MPGLPDAVDLVLDIGANIGAAALWFHRRYPQAEVVGVEADPRTAAVARANLADQAGVWVLNAAISDHAGEATLWVAPESWASSTAIAAGAPIRVPAVTLDEAAGRRGAVRAAQARRRGGRARRAARLPPARPGHLRHPASTTPYPASRMPGLIALPARLQRGALGGAERRCTFTARR